MYGYLGENGPKCEKDVKKQKQQTHYFPSMKYAVYFKRRQVKRYLKIAGAKEKSTRAQHLSTFPTSRVRTAVIPIQTFKCGLIATVHFSYTQYCQPQMFSFFRCFSLYMILVVTFLVIFADSEIICNKIFDD